MSHNQDPTRQGGVMTRQFFTSNHHDRQAKPLLIALGLLLLVVGVAGLLGGVMLA